MDDDLARLFPSGYVKQFLNNKHIVVIGDSVQRSVYKDLVLLLQEDRMMLPQESSAKGEASYLGDTLVHRTELSNGKDFVERREWQTDRVLVQYYYVTRCLYEEVDYILSTFAVEPPDVILMNSCLWDISRYGPRGEDEYKDNITSLFSRLKEILPPSSMFIWCATLPVSSHITPHGFLLPEIDFISGSLRVCILEANYLVAQIAAAHGFDFLDLHFYLRAHLVHRKPDGVHWNPVAHRHISDLILTFLHDAWKQHLPRNVRRKFLIPTDFQIQQHHAMYRGEPDFVRTQMRNLEAIADSVAPTTSDIFPKSDQSTFAVPSESRLPAKSDQSALAWSGKMEVAPEPRWSGNRRVEFVADQGSIVTITID